MRPMRSTVVNEGVRCGIARIGPPWPHGRNSPPWGMNWLDLVLLVWIGLGAIKGFRNGFVIELCALLGVLLGIWGAVHFSDRVSAWLGWNDADRPVIAFLVTMLLVMALVHLGARAMTKAIDLVHLSLPNKVMGVLFGLVRAAFLVSVLLNCVPGSSWGGSPSGKKAIDGSFFYAPVRSFAPVLVPALGETKWVKHALEELEREGKQITE